MMTLHERVWSHVSPDPNSGCWLWDASLDGRGYGQINVGYVGGGKTRRVILRRSHRVMYELVKGPIPDGMPLDHLCRVRSCINPDHLEPVTTAENLRRGTSSAAVSARAAKITHCVNGHPFSGANLSMDTVRGKPRQRVCLTCRRERQRKKEIGA